jgi:hypothetical protein
MDRISADAEIAKSIIESSAVIFFIEPPSLNVNVGTASS